MDTLSILQAVGQYASGLFAGAALYTAAVHQPSLAETLNNSELVVQFKAFYHKAARLQATFTVFSITSLIASYFINGDRWNLLAGLLMGTIFPYTVLVMFPVNNQFINATPGSAASKPFTKLFSTWGKLHWYRVIASLAAFGIATWRRQY